MEVQGTEIVSVAGWFLLLQVLEVWIVGAPGPQDCKRFPLKTGCRYAQVPFKASLTLTHLHNRHVFDLYLRAFILITLLCRNVLYYGVAAELRGIPCGPALELISEPVEGVRPLLWILSLSALMA
jgi:hypothetical protein